LHMPAIKLVGENIVLSNADSCLLYGSVRGLVRWCNLEEPRDTVIFPAEFTAEDIKGIQAVAAATDGDLFLLDGRRAAIYRFRSRAE